MAAPKLHAESQDVPLPPSIAALKPRKDEATPISREERQLRQERARKRMAENSLDAMVLMTGTSLQYFSGIHWWGGAGGLTLPMSEDCLACGARNPLGLQVALVFDDEGVWARVEPRPPWRLHDGQLHPALVPVLLDEVAWWLGALVMKEGGLTNRLAINILEPDLPADGVVVAAGRFDRVTRVDRKGAFWRSELALGTAAGKTLATASIIFRGGPEYSERQMPYFRSRAPLEVFRRMFPNYA